MSNEIVIVGFPKCGTTALINQYIKDPTVNVLMNPDTGSKEVTWPLIKRFNTSEIDGIRV